MQRNRESVCREIESQCVWSDKESMCVEREKKIESLCVDREKGGSV